MRKGKQIIENHFYDQNLFSYLATHPSPIETIKFVETLSEILSVNLFDNDFHVISTPISFLEAIGITSFPNVWGEINSNLKIEKQNIRELPSKLIKLYDDHFSRKLSKDTLIAKAKRQLKHISNPIVSQIVEEIIQHPLALLEQFENCSNNTYHKKICAYLALEHVQKTPYYELLAKIYPNNSERIQATRQLYHDFFSMTVDTIKRGINISYFRALDKARKVFALFGDAEERAAGRKFLDPYSKAYLKNNKDFNDSYLIHFALCGIYFNPQERPQRVLCFTLDDPVIIRARLSYAKTMLEWVNKVLNYKCPMCFGVVYCFDKSLEIQDTILVEDIVAQKI